MQDDESWRRQLREMLTAKGVKLVPNVAGAWGTVDALPAGTNPTACENNPPNGMHSNWLQQMAWKNGPLATVDGHGQRGPTRQ